MNEVQALMNASLNQHQLTELPETLLLKLITLSNNILHVKLHHAVIIGAHENMNQDT